MISFYLRDNNQGFHIPHNSLLAIVLFLAIMTAACQQGESATPIAHQTNNPALTPTSPTQTPTPVSSPTLTPTAGHTSTHTPTPTITPTPTPTALPITISAELHDPQIGPPVITGNAPCGLVDRLDFPLDPPNGANASGGDDFGRFRSRYDKFHAGEDWWGVRGRTSFGLPVYSIGHGLVTYAEPEGWNRDKGVIIIRHHFSDGSEVLSFYGHLDPPSVLLEPGDCVERGEQIAQIGRPLSSPHLHFEIRTQAPYQTLTGYWPEDPTLVGWLPPSAFIWNQRIGTSPGVQWHTPDSQPYTLGEVEHVGLNGNTLITIQSNQLMGSSIQDGRQQWQLIRNDEDTNQITNVYSALIDNRFPIVYIANRSGQIEALSLLGSQNDPTTPSLQSLWQIELNHFGRINLIPLANGGLITSTGGALLAISSDGAILWEVDEAGEPGAWAAWKNTILLSLSGDETVFGTADAAGLHLWETTQEWPQNSTPIVAGDQLWLYNRDGVYHLDMETKTADLQYTLPRGLSSLGDVIGLPDGGILLAHADLTDRRLLAFNADGSLRWERSYEEIITGSVHLVEQNGRVFLLNQETGANNLHSLYTLDLTNATLTQIFIGGTRSSTGSMSWISSAEDYLIINIGGGSMFALDPR